MNKILFITAMILIVYFVSTETLKLFPKNYQLHFFDVLLGDAILIQSPESKNYLIDASDGRLISAKLKNKISFLRPKIDAAFLSHADFDHLNGFLEILDQYELGTIFLSGANKKTKTFQSFLKKAREKKVRLEVLDTSSAYCLEKRLCFETLYLDPKTKFKQEENNNDSLVLMFEIDKKRFLFTGDIEKEKERELIMKGENLYSDVLKVPHHGSNSSSSSKFIKLTQPSFAVIQASKENPYKHPSNLAINRYLSEGINPLVTGVLGDITMCIVRNKNKTQNTLVSICP